ncbi:Mu transposase domain-containing protein [Nakamurella aerolata]|uniref:DDE-type integrase/transposase/recombinase n=1 Tax=Nakamurella aerolata TaxID=1656892 RepID=A0A849A4Z6_9ACTN|nr:DDE-type integrase/transposase/recombinase [Nakamurella aerolata]NNG34433.1 DDE-type integrase/transposase/recombinase [Nakamurella aerolata]NNG34437.1 DDE-type integrase/transposase/recombinase [Nakamurella aerolata]
MLTQEDDVDIHALRRRGWSISAIARHVGRDRKTVRAYLNGVRQVGQRAPAGEDAFARFVDYVAARLAEDPHLWATALFDEVRRLGYDRSYPSFTRALRLRGLRPPCERCRPATGRPVAVIEHPAGEETQWDWVELPDPPPGWDGYGRKACLLVGALAHSGKWRGELCEAMDQAQLAAAQHKIATKLGGVTQDWRFDRMATVVHPSSAKVTASYAAIAKHFGVRVTVCPPRRGNRKGVVEKANHTAAQRWWRSLPDDITAAAAQASLDDFCEQVTDQRGRIDPDGNRCTVADLAAHEPLRPVPAAPPVAVITVARKASAQALVSYRGNTYSVPPAQAGQLVTVSHRLDAATLSITTNAGVTVVVHHRRPDGAGAVVRTEQHVTALNTAAMTATTPAAPHRSKQRIPPGPAARAAADTLRGRTPTPAASAAVIDLNQYAQAAARRRTLPQ